METLALKVKKRVYEIIKNEDEELQSDNQWAFCAGLIFGVINTRYNIEKLSQNALGHRAHQFTNLRDTKRIKETIMSILQKKVDYVVDMPQFRKNLFVAFLGYTPEKEQLDNDMLECFVLGQVSNHDFLAYDPNPLPDGYVPLSEYAEKVGVDASTMRHRIQRGLHPSAVKKGKIWFLSRNEPLTDNRKNL